jgi:hypothetical protein
MLTKNLFDFLPHPLREEEKCVMLNQSINQSIKWLLLVVSWHDYNDDKDDILASTIYNKQQQKKSLLKII